jgi:hypothetical protein
MIYVLLAPTMNNGMDEYCVAVFEGALAHLASPEA